jgi:hypothetical protein
MQAQLVALHGRISQWRVDAMQLGRVDLQFAVLVFGN